MTVLHDIRFGLRLLAKSPGFTLGAVLALALGIGVNSMAFTVYNAALFKSLPFENPAQIVHIHLRNLREGWERGLQYDDYLEFRQARALTGLAAYMGSGETVTDDRGTPQHIEGEIVTPNTFSVLGQRPLLGRDFRDGDARPGAPRVAILSYGLWQTRYGGDAGIVGKSVTIGGAAHVIVGVMPRGMEFPFKSKFWTLVIDTPENRRSFDYRGGFQVIGRLRDGVTVGQGQTELTELGRVKAQVWRAGTEPVVVPYIEWAVKPQQKQLSRALMGAVTFVLLIACANVANLLMARAVARGREIAIRISLGASRGRLVRQLLIESLLLGLLGGAAGLLLAVALIRWFVHAIEPLGIPYWIDWSMDATSFMYLLAISVLSGLVFGLLPALQVAKIDAVKGLRESGRQASAGGRSRSLTAALVVVEISLTIALMVGAGLFVRSLMTLDQVDVGFRTQNLLTMTVPLDERKYPQPAAFVEPFAERLTSVREIAAFTFASKIPGSGSDRRYLKLSDRDLVNGDGAYPRVATVSVSPGYFKALGLTMARGREFAQTDGGEGSEAVIVNQRFASQYWPGDDPIGKRIRLGNAPWATVIGVSPTIRQTSLHRDVEALVYQPPRQAWSFWFVLIARVSSTPEAAAKALREAASAADADLTLLNLQTYDEFLDRAALETRLLSEMFSMFATIGIALSAFGIYAVTAYATSQRTQEIGVRIALGATRADVVRLILQSGLRQLAVALPIGFAAAAAVSRVLAGALFEISPLDPPTFLSIPVMLFVIVVAACVVPAWRAARLNPLDALRE